MLKKMFENKTIGTVNAVAIVALLGYVARGIYLVMNSPFLYPEMKMAVYYNPLAFAMHIFIGTLALVLVNILYHMYYGKKQLNKETKIA
ncbi:MAG: hypothetical protein Q4Q17_05430 [Tissierellia bacterium]|nr:hypothetical protein [Tissierellia bacterium]